MKTDNPNLVSQLPITISDESADQVRIVKTRQVFAWFIILVMLAGICFYIIQIGLRTGYVKSHIWLTVSIISVVSGLVLTNTLRVFLHVLIMSFCKKEPQDQPLFACDPKLGMRMDLVGDKTYLDKLLVRRSRPEYYPLKPELIEEKRKSRKNKQLWFCLLDWIAIMMVCVLVVFGTVTSMVKHDYNLTHHMEHIIKYGVVSKNISSGDHIKLAHIYNRSILIDYFKNTLSYMFGTLVWYNGYPLAFKGGKIKETGWAIDYTNRLVGVVRLRLKRTKIENCVPALLRKLLPSVMCVKPLTNANEDKSNYSMDWLPESKSYSDTSMAPWHYKPSSQVQALIKYGATGRFYTNGGYFLNLPRTSDDTNRIIAKMESSNWFSEAARVIFMDISMYSPNLNKIKVISVSLEIRAGYGIDLRFRMISLPAYTTFPLSDMICMIFLGIVLTFLIIDLFISLLVMGTAFFHSFWNILDIFIVPLFALNFIYGLKYQISLKFNIEHDLRSGQDKFFYFGWLDYYSYIYFSLFTLLFVFCSIKPFKYCTDTLQVFPIVMTIYSAWHFMFYIFLFFVPFLYIKFSVIDSLLSNSQMISNRFPLVNKVGLKNYAEMYIFPERRLMPYLYCQLCSVIIGLLSVFIIHHYIITKNSLIQYSNTVDLPFELKKWIQSGKRKEQFIMLKNKCEPIIRQRLRSGADCFDKSRAESQTTTNAISFSTNQNTLEPLDDEREYKWSNDKVNIRKQKGKGNKRNMENILKNIDMKLDKIVENLRSINEEL